MKDRCKSCSVYESGTCRCKNCNDICKNSTSPSYKLCTKDDGETLQQHRKNIFADLNTELTYLSDKELIRLAFLVRQEKTNREKRKYKLTTDRSKVACAKKKAIKKKEN